MYRHIRPYLSRHEPRGHFHLHFKSTLGAMLGLLAVGALAAWSGQPLLLAPLGATALLLFAHPKTPTAQPVNIFLGYLVGTVFASICEAMMPGSWWAAGFGVGGAMLVMLSLRITHPPASAMPLLMLTSHLPAVTLFMVVLAACLVLFTLAMIWHRLPPRQIYPLTPPSLRLDEAKHPVLELSKRE